MNRTGQLKPIFADMDPTLRAEIREAYYKAAEGLAALDRLMAEAGDHSAGLAGEARHVSDARREFNRSGLGAIL